MKKIFWTLVLLAVVAGGGWLWLKHGDTISAWLGDAPDPAVTSTGVVSLRNAYYYHLTLPDGKTLYFSDMDDSGFINLTFERDSVKPTVLTGTACFVDTLGTLLTAQRLADPQIIEGEAQLRVQDLVDRLLQWAQNEKTARAREYHALEDSINQCFALDANDSVIEVKPGMAKVYEKRRNDLMGVMREAQDAAMRLRNIDVTKVKMGCVSDLSVAYNGSDVTVDNMVKCNLVKGDGSEVTRVRLASGVTPAGAFRFADAAHRSAGFASPRGAERGALHVGDKVTVLTANAGAPVRVTITTAHVTQVSHGRALIDIGNATCNVGSTVVNEYGDLVGTTVGSLTDAPNFHHVATNL